MNFDIATTQRCTALLLISPVYFLSHIDHKCTCVPPEFTWQLPDQAEQKETQTNCLQQNPSRLGCDVTIGL